MSGYSLTVPISELLDQDVKERSINAMLLCPFHEEDTPSFSIHLEEGVWHCFGCGRKGNLEGLYHLMNKEMGLGLYLDRAVRKAATDFRPKPDFTWLADELYDARRRGDGATVIKAYLRDRPIDPEVLDEYRVGFDGDKHAISLPYFDRDGVATGIKYRYHSGRKSAEPGSEFGLYGMGFRGSPVVYVCEGESDTQAVYSRVHGTDGVGVCGTSGSPKDERRWNDYSLDLLFAQRIYLCYDADDSGDGAASTAQGILGDKAIRIRPTKGNDLSDHFNEGGTLIELGVSDIHI